MDIKELKELIEAGVGMVVATRDAEMRPDLCVAMGVSWSEDPQFFTVYIDSQRSKQALRNIQDNSHIAVSLSRPCTFKAAQLKGRVVKVREMNDLDREQSKKWSEGYRKEIRLIGVMSDAALGLLRNPDTAAEVRIENIYNQTPGPNAGRPLGDQ